MQSLSWIQIQDNVTYLGIDMFKKKKKKVPDALLTGKQIFQTIHGHSIYLVSMISHDK